MNAFRAFTLIELILSIVLIGILSAVIIPRFANLSDAAVIAQAEGVAGSLRSSVSTVKALFQSQGHATRIQNLQGFGNNNVDTNNQGYPIGIDKGNGNESIGQRNKGCAELWQGLLSEAPSVAHNNDNQQYRSFRHTQNRVCSYVYRDDGDTGNQNTGQIIIRYDSRDGSVTVCGQSSLLPAC